MEKHELESYKKAGQIAAQTLEYGAGLIKPGASILEVTGLIEKKIRELGGDFAFPPQISLNEVAAHSCIGPDDPTTFKEGDVVKLDVGVHIDGYVGDNAVTVVLGDDERKKRLAEASRAALEAAIAIAKPGVAIKDLGGAISKTIKERGFVPVSNLSGHGLSRYVIHDSPSIPNFDTGNTETLKEGQVIAIEPFASTGSGVVYESGNATIYSVSPDARPRGSITREIMRTIETFGGLPFTLRWLVDKHGHGKAAFALRELRTIGALREYPPLPDGNKGLVSQAEHTVIISDPPIITTRSKDLEPN